MLLQQWMWETYLMGFREGTPGRITLYCVLLRTFFWCVSGLGLGKYYLERLYTFCMCKHKMFLSYSDGMWRSAGETSCILHFAPLKVIPVHRAGMFVWVPFIRDSGEYCWFLITENNIGMYLRVPGAIVDKSLSCVVKVSPWLLI